LGRSLGRSEKIQALGMPERVLICWQLKSHWGSPHGKVHFTIWQWCIGNVELATWEWTSVAQMYPKIQI